MSAGPSSLSSTSNPEVFARLASTCPSFRKLRDAAGLTDHICASFKLLANKSSDNARSSSANATSSRPAPHDTTTALAFVIKEPKAVQQINSIRETRDRAFKRWMPHINFIFPFVHPAQFELIRNKIAKLNIQSFDIAFEKVDHFPQQNGQCSVHLRCNAESERKLVDVFNKILQACPEIVLKRSKFVPHLTLGQCQSSDLQAMVESFTNAMPDVIKHRFAFDELHFLHRNPESGDKMVSRMSIGLSPASLGEGEGGVGGICDGTIVDNTSFLIESIGKYAITTKTTQPSIYLACIAEAVLLSKSPSAPILSERCGESIRSLFIQCIHGTAPEAIRDQALSSILTLFSCRNQIGLAWTLDNSSKSDRGVSTSSANSSPPKPTSGSNTNFFNNPENNKGLSYSSKPTNDNFIKLYVNMIATEIHVTIEEFLFYLANPSPSATATTTTQAEGGSSTGRGPGTAPTAVGGSSSGSSGSTTNGNDCVSKRTARLNRCERALYLLLLGTEFAVQFLVGPDEDSDDEDIDFDGGVVGIDDDDCKDPGWERPYVDSDDEVRDDGLGGRRYNNGSGSGSGVSKGGSGHIGNNQTASKADLAVDWTCVSFEIVESIQQALHSVANDIYEFIDQFRRSELEHRKLESKWYSDSRVDLLLRRLLSVISLLAEEDVVIYRKFNNSIPNILHFSELVRYYDSVDGSIDFNEISANKVSDLAHRIFGYTSPSLEVNNNSYSSSSSSSSNSSSKNEIYSEQKAWDDIADITIPASNSDRSASVSDVDDIIGFYIIDVAEDSSVGCIGNQCDLLYTIFPLLYSYLVLEDFGVDASFLQTFQVLSVHLLKTLHILLLFNSKMREDFISLKGPESDIVNLSTQFSIQILELLPKLLFNDSCDQSSSSSSLRAGVYLWEKVGVDGKSVVRSRIDAVSRMWSSHLRKRLNGGVTSLNENETAGIDETMKLINNFSKLCK